MNKLAESILVIFLLLCLLSNGFAQENAVEVIANFVQAVGGQNHIEKIQNIYAFADCIGPNGKYQTEISSATNGRTIFRQIRKDKPDYIGQTNNETFWTKGSDVEIANKSSAFVWRSHEFQWIAIHPLERFRELKFVGYEDFGGKKAVKLSANDVLGRQSYLYFDEGSKLLLGFTILDPFGEKPESIRLTFNEWKKVNKLLLPSKVTATDKQGDFVLNFRTIKLNRLDEKVFEIPPKIVAIEELLELHNQQRMAHFNRDAKLLVSMFDEDFVEIRNGQANPINKEDALKRFQSYLDASTFIEWDDINPPIIKVSDDAKMAYVIVSKRVRLKTKDGKEVTDIFAWTATFHKIRGKWLMTSIASTVQAK